ncbi:MAG: hypothetical protein KC609_13330, partial [Myxococcales bacterium]|nr:hypothetical protein [Myxococcales bacterium]
MIRECRAIVLIATLLLVVSCGSAKRKVGALCQSDGECVGGLCLEGLCSALQSCQSSGDCGAGVCSEGYCWTTSCTTNDQCPSYAECNQGYCVRRASESDATDGNDSRDLSSELSCSSALDCGDRVGVLGACEIADCVNGACVKTNKPKGSSCDDGDGCTLLDECDANGLCVGSTNPCVDENDPCK